MKRDHCWDLRHVVFATVVLRWNISASQLEPGIDVAKTKKAMALSWAVKPRCFKGHSQGN